MDSVIYLIGERSNDFQGLMRALTQASLNVFCYQSAESFLSQHNQTPGIAIVDQDLPGMDGIALLHLLLEDNSTISSILASCTPDTRLAVESMRLGAHDFVQKPFDIDQLADFVIQLNARQRECREREKTDRIRAARVGLLSPREREVFNAVTKGLTSKEIADSLCISPRTIEVHRYTIRKKIGSGCLAESVRAAVLVEQRSAHGKPEWAVVPAPQDEPQPGMISAKTNGYTPQADSSVAHPD